MAAHMLCRRLQQLLVLKTWLIPTRSAVRKAAHESVKEEGKRDHWRNCDFSLLEHRRLNNDSSFHRSLSRVSRSQSVIDEDHNCVSRISTSFRPQKKRSSSSSISIAEDILIDPRSFLKCRPEYSAISVGLTQRLRSVLNVDEVWGKYSSVKCSTNPTDFTKLIVELSTSKKTQRRSLMNDERFKALLQGSSDKLDHLTDSQLLDVLRSFVWLKMSPDHKVLEMYEKELCRRGPKMSLKNLLFAADAWRRIKRQVPRFLKTLYQSVKCKQSLRVFEFVHLVYIIGEGRHCPADLIDPLSQLLIVHLQELKPEEVGVVCLGFFKSQTKISAPLAMKLFDRAHEVSVEISDFALVNVFKYLRFTYLYHGPWIKAMTREVPLRAHRMGAQGLMHVTLGCSAIHYRCDTILTAVAERIPSLVPQSRSKDLCKFIWSFGSFGFLSDQCPNFYPSLIQGLREKEAEFLEFPQNLLTGLIGLAFVSEFPEDLISLALSTDFIKLLLKESHLDLKNDLLTLDGVIELELPHWTGPRLNPELRAEVTENVWKSVQEDMNKKPGFQEAETCIKDVLGGAEFYRKRMILPHTRSLDFEVHLDPSGKPVALNQTLNESRSDPGSSPSSDIMERLGQTAAEPQNTSGVVKLAIQLTTNNIYCYNTDQMMGFHALKRRHLALAGYKAVEMNRRDWLHMLKKSKQAQLRFMRSKIFANDYGLGGTINK